MIKDIFFKKDNYKICIIFSTIIIFILASFVITGLWAELLYQKSFSVKKDYLLGNKLKRYNQAIALITKAIKIRKDKASYYATKADYLFEISSGSINRIQRAEIEELYKKAVNINSINFEYYLKLGWFYSTQNDLKAEEFLLKASQLKPKEYKTYFYLSKHYFKNQKPAEAFNNILLFMSMSLDWRHRKILDELKEEISHAPRFLLTKKTNDLIFTIYPKNNQFSFKKEGFAHVQIPLIFRVYAKGTPRELQVHKEGLLYGNFVHSIDIEGYRIYEYSLDPYSDKTYLDDLIIRIDPLISMEKIEVIKKL